MRGLTPVTFALAGLAANVAAHSPPVPVAPDVPQRRKTLGFGPALPHARFQTSAAAAQPFAPVTNANADPLDVARDFMANYADPATGRAYVIRPDSYTDNATGVTHVYARQVVGGIEVADAHINLNIKDGKILSFGDSFFPGPAPALASQPGEPPVHPHAAYCSQLASAVSSHRSLANPSYHEAPQTPMSAPDSHKVTQGLATLEHLYASNCANVPSLSSFAGDSSQLDLDPRRPLLAFLASALPDSHPALSSIEQSPDALVSGMVLTPESHLLGDHVSVGVSLGNVPGAVSEVKARMVWVQVPREDGSVRLELVHRYEIELEHNWYEATVSATLPHRIVSVVDWASDSPLPMPEASEEHLPTLGAFIPPGSNFESVGQVKARGKKFGKGSARKARKGKAGKKSKECHAKHVEEVDASFAPIPPSNPSPPKVTEATYVVFPWGTNDPVEAAERKAGSEGEKKSHYSLSYGRETTSELRDTLASPAGWHTLPFSKDPSISDAKAHGGAFWRTTNTTWGNNVFAQENWEGRSAWMFNRRPEGDIPDGDSGHSPSTVFSFPYAPSPMDSEDASMREAREHIDATVTQLFYTSNMVHDLFYQYGFTEPAGNFQQYNFGRGGAEGDAVIANAQDGSGFNNANFMTPPDGQNGRCRMYLWNTDSPYPDGDMEAGIVIHELSHGLSTRLTGGPKNSGCLGWGESGGMGEGWGDFIATTVRSIPTYSDYPMGAWASNRKGGIRNYAYSISTSVNPSTYKTLDKPGYWGVHAIGEVWAEMLFIVLQRFIDKHGFSETLFPPVPNEDGSLPPNDFYREQTFNLQTGKPNPLVPKHGNTLLLQLVLNGMKLQPCTPSFFDARDAIIQADEVLTGGENVCDLWAGFAERGLGVDATLKGSTPWGGGIREDGLKVPASCRGESEPKPEPEPKPTPGDPDEECGPFGWCWFKNKAGRWIPKLPWSRHYGAF
ncbi:Fungalysin metallopeptidase-domain-containing protein [Phlebopus sp. FC_14]|nr:Fungalysin metallopeptidase-domain-containing protein [Phlebopus sp. FC_14]